MESEVPVAHGRWGKPQCLTEAKYDFLVIDATVASTKDGTKSETLGNHIGNEDDVRLIVIKHDFVKKILKCNIDFL